MGLLRITTERICFIFLLLAGTLLVPQARAAERAPGPAVTENRIAREPLLEQAHRDNPEIRAARSRWAAARARVPQASALPDPHIAREWMYAPRGSDVVSDAQEKNWFVSQDIPFPTTLYHGRRAAVSGAARAEAALRDTERDVLARVKTVYARLALNAHHREIFSHSVELLRRFVAVAQAKYTAGDATQAEALRAQVELARLLNTLDTLDEERHADHAFLNSLLNQPAGTPVGETEPLVPRTSALSAEQMEQLALERSPFLAGTAAAVEESRSEAARARSGFFPDIQLAYRRREMRMGADSHDAMVGLRLPLWIGRQRAAVHAADAAQDAAEAERAAANNAVLAQVRSLAARARAARRSVELYRTGVLPQSEHALRVLDAAYQAGQAAFLDLLEAQRDLLDARAAYYRSLADHDIIIAELEHIIGADLERRRL